MMKFAPADHSVACQAHAIICAVENLRDSDDMTSFDFKIAMQDNKVHDEGYSYIDFENWPDMANDVCKCHVRCMHHVMTVHTYEGVTRAQELATAYLQDGQITTGNYITLVKWTEGRA